MLSAPLPFPLAAARPAPRLILAAVALLHVGALLGWQASRPAPHATARDTRTFEWVWILPPRPTLRSPPRTAPPVVPAPTARRATKPPIQLPVDTSGPVRVAEPSRKQSQPDLPAPAVPDDPFAEPTTSEAERGAALMAQARRAAGQIDQQLRKEAPRRPERLHVPGKQERLAAGIAAAAVRSGVGPAQIEEINPGDHSGDRLYRITGMFGTYCLRYPSPTRGIDSYTGSPKVISCP